MRVYIWDAGNAAVDRDSYPIVLLPGRSSGVPMWSANVSALIHSRQVIAFDALGDAGLSVQSAPLTSMGDQAAWIDQVVTAVAPGESTSSGTPSAARPPRPMHGSTPSGSGP